MAQRLEDLATPEVGQIEQARRRARRGAERRELLTEAVVSAAFLAAAVAMLVVLGLPERMPWMALWLTGVCAVLVRIEFEVGEGRSHPILLAVVPMLVLVPPAQVPLAVAAGHLAAGLPELLTRRTPPHRTLLLVANSWFSVAPACVAAALGPPDDVSSAAVMCAAALSALVASDVVVSSLRMAVGLGIDPRRELRGFAWVCLADLCLAPVGFVAAIAGGQEPLVIGGVLPLAGLLAIFARERQGRIANALELQHVAQQGRDRLQTIVQNSSDLIAILDRDGTIRTLMGSVEAVFGPDAQDAEGEALAARVHPEDAPLLGAFLAAVLRKGDGEALEGEWRLRYADGSHRHIAAVATNLLADVRVGGIVLTARDVNDRKAFEEQLRHRAFHDGLTGLANRALFYDRIEHALTRGARRDADVAVLFVDLDDFKSINDSLGHAQGDRLLEEAARRLTSALRSADTAARLGGDEFGVLLEGVTDPETVIRTAGRVLDALAQPLALGDHSVSLSASIGMAISAQGERGVEEFLRRADLAMYEAKRNGKRRAELYQPHLERTGARDGDRAQWFSRNDEQRKEIEDVLADPDAITVVFQPIMDLRTGRIAGYESLSRFNREPRRTPDIWFAQAHRCGLGYALEAKAIAAALATPGRPAGTYLTVNVSPSSLIAEEVLRVLPERLDGLVVEVTENELVSGDPAILDALAGLRARGALLAVDDTGAGYAGLTNVIRLRPDIIKLDRALTTGVDADPVKAALISSFVRYGRDIDATICAEGVETFAELERLADLDVAYGQGYVLARPGPPWAELDPEASAECLLSFEASLAEHPSAPGRTDHDRRLEALARRLATVGSGADLESCLPTIAEELNADEVRLLPPDGTGAGASHLLAEDPAADPDESRALLARGYRARLTLPIADRGTTIARLEACAVVERPWSRFEIERARIIAHQLGPVLERNALAR